jgi:hypothetical protein
MALNFCFDKTTMHVKIAGIDSVCILFIYCFNGFPLFSRDLKKLAENVTKEQGKTLPDAEGDVIRGLQVVDFSAACNFIT